MLTTVKAKVSKEQRQPSGRCGSRQVAFKEKAQGNNKLLPWWNTLEYNVKIHHQLKLNTELFFPRECIDFITKFYNHLLYPKGVIAILKKTDNITNLLKCTCK